MVPSSLSDGLRATLDVFERTAPGTPLTTTEVAERLDVGRRSTYTRLERLAERDLVSTKKVGARGRVWWRPQTVGSAPAAASGAPAAELEAVFDRIDDAVWALDGDWRFTYINERAEELLERSAGELVGEVLWEALPWLEDQRAKEKLEEAMTTGRTVHYEDYVEATDRWYGVRAYPSESGLSVYYQEITERKERERALAESERNNRALVENFPNGAVALFDEELRHVTVGGQLFAALDVTPDEMTGRTPADVFPPAVSERVEPHFRAVFDGESREFEVELGGEVRLFRTHPIYDDDDEIVAGLGMSQDVTERRERERELERYETIVETIDDGVYALDEDGDFVLVNDAYCELVGHERESLVGAHATVVHDEEVGQRSRQLAREVAAGERELATIELELDVGGRSIPLETRLAPYPIGDGYGRCGVVRDVTERIERERELERYVGIVDAVGEPVYELDAAGRILFVNDALVEYSGYREDELLGEHPTIIMDDEAVARAESHIVRLLADEGAVRTALEYEIVTKHGDRIPVENRITVRTDEDGRFRGSAGLMWDVTERKERQRELERQHERLEALNVLHGVVREVTDAVIEQSTREEIERIVCERLAGTEPYESAWIGDVDGQSGTVDLRAEAGVDRFPGERSARIYPAGGSGGDPTGRALVEREIQVARDVDAGADHAVDGAGADGDRSHSVAAIPIVHEGTLFGALAVYADRPEAFPEEEQAVIGRLGEVVGHAIAAVDRKRALMSDEVVEIEFQIPNVFGLLDVPAPAEGVIRFERTVPLAEGTFLVYGTATGDAVDALEAIVQTGALAHWRSLSVLSSNGDGARFELRMDEPPVISTAATHGGYVADARMEHGDYHMRLHLAPSADVRQVVDALEDVYPDIAMVSRRQVNRGRVDGPGPAETTLAALTDRQRTAVETAFYSGYFERPRERNGADVAGSLGIDPSTFHHHLREAQRKILERVLAREAAG